MVVEGHMTFNEFVLARSTALHRTAVLVTGEPHAAHDLLQEALLKAWKSWDRITEQPEGYVRTILLREFLTGRRRRGHGEVPTEALPEAPARTGAELETHLTLGISVGTARSYHSRALAALRVSTHVSDIVAPVRRQS